MNIIDVQQKEIAKTPHKVEVKKLFSFDHATIVHITLNPRESLKLHKTPVDVNFYVLEGQGVVKIGEEEEKVSKDQLIFSPANIPHLLRNESNSQFRFLVIKTPTPTKETKIL